jgi:hypothetical protein
MSCFSQTHKISVSGDYAWEIHLAFPVLWGTVPKSKGADMWLVMKTGSIGYVVHWNAAMLRSYLVVLYWPNIGGVFMIVILKHIQKSLWLEGGLS